MLVDWKDGFRSTMMSKMKDGARGGEVERTSVDIVPAQNEEFDSCCPRSAGERQVGTSTYRYVGRQAGRQAGH